MKTEKANNSITIQLRYCFRDENLHSMNAEIFNECERQFIKALKSIEKYLEDTLSIDIKPREEGSLIDIFTIAINNPAITTTFTALVSITATKFFDSKFSVAKHKTEETSKRLENVLKIKEEIKNGTITEDDFDYVAGKDKSLQKCKSNFFKSIKKEQKIEQLETKTTTNYASQPVIIVVSREDFDNFILPDTIEKNEEIRQAKIYIVAPILIKGRRDSWKGIYEKNSIDFKITDNDFLEQVWNQLVKFGNGTFINCDLKIIKTINVETEEIKISREVINVINYGDDDKQIRKITHKRKMKNNDNVQQLTLFDDLQNK